MAVTWQQRNPGENRSYSYPSENKKNRRFGDLPQLPSSEDPMSYTGEGLARQLDALKQNSYFRNQGGFSGMQPNFYAQGPSSPESGGLWGGLKKMASGMGVKDWSDVIGTGYKIYDNERFVKPMLQEQHARAADIWNTQKPMLEFNLATGIENQALKKQNDVRLWNNLSRKEGEAERTIENWTPTTYA